MTTPAAVDAPVERPPSPGGLLCRELEVPLVSGERVRYANLDNAASTSALVAVQRTVDELLPWYSSVHRGAGFASMISTDVYDASREVVRHFVGARDEDIVIFTRNTTDAINLLARTLPERTTVINFTAEHHANLLPWRRGTVRHLPVPAGPDDALDALDRALSEAPDGPRLVAVTGASNVSGELWPVRRIASVARRHGARVALDAAQLAPHRPLDIAAWGIDYVAFSGHKLYAPFGAGVLAGRRDWLDQARPYLDGGGAVRRVTADEAHWHIGPARHEAGTPPVIGAAAIAAACLTLTEIGWDAIVEHEADLLDRLQRGLDAIDAVTTYAMWAPPAERIGVVTFNLAGVDGGLLAAVLSAEYGIGVRHGAFCAHPLMRELIGTGTAAAAAVRASIGIGTSCEDVDRLVDALHEIAAHGPRWEYRLRDGQLVPDPDPRPRPSLGGLLVHRSARASLPAPCGSD